MKSPEQIKVFVDRVTSYPVGERERIYQKYFAHPSDTVRFLCQNYGLDQKRVIDMTCHYGYYLAYFGEGSVGLDGSQQYLQFAREMGFETHLFNIEEEFADYGEAFDALLFSGTLEEILSPHVALMRFRQLLKPDGLLCLRVPTVPPRWFEWLYYDLRHRQSGYQAQLHLYFFTPRTLKMTVERAGYDVLQVVSPGIWMHPYLRWAHALLLDYAPTSLVIARPRPNFKYPAGRAMYFLPDWAKDLAPYHQDYEDPKP